METLPALVIGAGPAGLMAAETMAASGVAVTVTEARPSAGRKLLMAGKSGLNLTRDEPDSLFVSRYDPPGALAAALADFGPRQVQDWARGLGQELFTGSTRRVFPVAMKASPLLRAWLARLAGQGVRLRLRWRWTGWIDGAARFETPEGARCLRAGVTVLALGGASWPRLGSDGAWTRVLEAAGVPLAPFRPANAGLRLPLSKHLQGFLGWPVKNVGLIAGGRVYRGEFVLSARGLEGGGLYPLTPLLREGARLALDLAPDLEAGVLAERLAAARGSIGNRLRKAGLDPVRAALAQEFGRPLPGAAVELAALLKALPVPFEGVRPLSEAISTAGGIRAEGLTGGLELKALPGVFAAGEMLDWEAPTGGYLLTGCLASGRLAGRTAATLAGDLGQPGGWGPGRGGAP